MSWLFEPECRPKCRSKRHALEFHSSISKGTLKEVKAYSRLCHNVTKVKDTVGRSALHMAAACGKADIVEWLLTDKHGDMTDKDSESGWTALHRALFYGQLPVARQLIQHGTDLYTRDHEGLSALDIVMKDKPREITFNLKEPNEVYAWGDNPNFNLGHASGQSRASPEVIDEFKRTGISLKDMVLCKYHTVFLSQAGQVYTCGHGHGGRLGHENELPCVVPMLVKTVRHETCLQIVAARDHTVMLMESGAIFTCGLNAFHQLGLFPPPDKSVKPRQIYAKLWKGRNVLGVCVGSFHTVVYTADAVFTFGLNAGQLGHQKGEKLQSQPRLVSALSQKDIALKSVTCSDAATVCLTKKGDIFVLHEYQCRRIMSKWLEVGKVLVCGGKLDYHAEADRLREKGGSDLSIALLSVSSQVFIWRESSPTLRRCQWSIKRQLFVVDVVCSDATVAFITEAGEGFMGYWPERKHLPQKEVVPHKKMTDDFEKPTLIDLMLKDEVEIVPVKRIPNMHRATKISADRRNNNLMVLQALPHGCLSDIPSISDSEMSSDFQRLREEADEYDAIHDVTVQAGNHRWPCHKYILVSKCDFLRNKVASLTKTDEEFPDEEPVIHIPSVPPEIMEQVLQYIYNDTCDLLKVGTKFSPVIVKGEGQEKGQGDADLQKDNSDLLISENLSKMSAYEVHQKKKKSVQKENADPHNTAKNPVRYLQDVAKELGVKGLSKRLDAVKYLNGCVQSAGKFLSPPKVKFDRRKLPELCDVSIEAEDGTMIQCHKCVLVARLEYFHSMLGCGWMETSDTTSLTLPVPGDVLSILLDYLYSDESQVVTDCQKVELLCNVLVVADQLLAVRLKEMCEVSLANLITFRNVGEILEFASMYNATQLRATCQQFISLNLAALLEGRYLDVLSGDTMVELKEYYRDKLSCMCRRLITPYSGAPERDYLESLAAKYQDEEDKPSHDVSSKKHKPKKRRSRTKSTSDETDKGRPGEVPSRGDRHVSISSDISVEEERDEEEQEHPEEKTPEATPVKPTDQHCPTPSATIPVPGRGKENPWGYSSPSSPRGIWGAGSPPPPESLPSPQSPPGGVSLRDIMSQQKARISHSTEKRAPGGKVSWKEVKKQQNKAAQDAAAQKQAASVTSPTSPAPAKQSTCPWGSVSKVVKSFRDLLLEDKVPQGDSNNTITIKTTTKPASAPSKPASSREHMSWGLPTRNAPRSRPSSQSEPVAMPATPTNPWVTTVANSPPASSFSDILRDEQARKKTLDYASKKPLNLIQIEEQAIQQLLGHYQSGGDNQDEHVTVERVPQVTAAPLWSVSKQRANQAKF
ncbi:inhibitor of Bruton tyrosine kinase-like [Haliotis rufescens]|uniref:inhibitor of Bruton tyrosine kinase-like n=1 Tax=Haliotis rufescens TaxID=6454 RepID=UPI00201ED8C4|nr:inhibitor of Bruton tyrosine kinase-like [Haliotis rufescens]